MTSPMYSSGVTTSTAMIGSRRTGLAMRAASLNAMVPAILNAISEESTSWNEPSSRAALHVDEREAGEHARVERGLDALVDRADVLLGDAPTGDLVVERVALAGLGRLQRDGDVGELARATRLLLVGVAVLLDRRG